MTTPLSPYDVAEHWPFLERHLRRLPPATARALDLVATAQVESGGDAVPIRARALALPYGTPGTAGRVGVVLAALERRGVVWRYPGRGRLPALWSFAADLTRWRGMDWSTSAAALCQVVSECSCRAGGAFVARFPGQGVSANGVSAQFDLLSRDHTRPPGLFVVEMRDNRADRATNAGAPGLLPVETRDKTAGAGAPSSLLEEQLFLEGNEEQFAMLKKAAEARTGQELRAGSTPARRLAALAARLTVDQAALVAAEVRRIPGHTYFPKIADEAADIATSPAVKRAGRTDAWSDGPQAAAF